MVADLRVVGEKEEDWVAEKLSAGQLVQIFIPEAVSVPEQGSKQNQGGASGGEMAI